MTRRSDSVTIRDVAKHAAVSVATISRFINQNAPVSQEVSERIQQVMLDLNYKPHAAARHLAMRRTQTIGLVLHNMHTDFFAPLLSGIESVVSENQYNLLVATYKSPARKDSQPPIGPHNTDGMLVFADSLSEEHLTMLCQNSFPLVLIHRTPPVNLKIPFVTVENKAATRKIIDHLIEVHGRRSILFLRGPREQEDSRWREQGYLESLNAHGIPVNPDLFLDGEFSGEIAYHNIKKIIARKELKFDAVFTGDDDAAIGSLTALHESGLRVPEDVSMVGFDDSRLSPFLSPPLTTVRAPTEDVGRRAATLLFSMIREQPVELVTLLPTEIIIRRSCGCLREATAN
ncbi:MAG TPA: LacI family DNA-binding transcriptional regulator [Anaerolineales bacterium]|jgi:DNA-binding LacI/PurR family transcriptional regulator